jgi:short subunit dehydrogenase-like uncharacterized protein
MARRIVLFGATGHTGRLCAERLVAQGERPVLAGRSEERLADLAGRLDVEWRAADAGRPASVFALVERDDVLVATVGPFARWGLPAVRAAVAAPAVYLDSTGEPGFIRRVVEELGPPAARGGATLLPAMGYDYVPGALAGALALEESDGRAERVDVGYFMLGGRPGMLSRGTAASAVGAVLEPMFAFRDGKLRTARAGERRRSFRVDGREREAISIGGAEHIGLPRAYPRLREVGVYLGVAGGAGRVVQAAGAAAAPVMRLPGVRWALRSGGERLAALLPAPAPGTPADATSQIVAVAYDGAGRPLAEVHLGGVDGYAFTAGFLAWAARRAAHDGVDGVGALGPLEAFGLEALERGCAEAGIARVAAERD